MVIKSFFGSLLLICSSTLAQFSEINSVKINHSWFTCDPYKNVYAISENKFLRSSPPYKIIKNFNLQKEGIPGYIDINNPNKIILFFQNTGRVILLDSGLNVIDRPFFLNEVGLDHISMIFSSKDAGLWFYNYLNNSFIKLDRDFLRVIPSVPLSDYFPSPNHPNFITLFQDLIYINIPTNGILILGPGGEYKTAVQLHGLIDFQTDGDFIYYYRDNIIYCLNIKSLKTRKIYLPSEQHTLNAWFYRNQVILLRKDGFTVYHHSINPENIENEYP